MQPQRDVRERAVIANGDAHPAEPRQYESGRGDLPSRDREENQAGDCQKMNRQQVQKCAAITLRSLPPWLVPWFRTETGDNRSVAECGLDAGATRNRDG